MPVAEAPEKLSLVVFSGEFERVHYALAMAAAAAASNTSATLFFTMGACRALARPGPAGRPGWWRLPAENGDAVQADAALKARGLADFETLLAACAALGVTVMVCEMGLRALGMEIGELRDDIPVTPGGIVTFLADASRHGAMLFV